MCHKNVLISKDISWRNYFKPDKSVVKIADRKSPIWYVMPLKVIHILFCKVPTTNPGEF